MSSDTSRPLRSLRSFVRREGRITAAQRRALDTLLPLYGVQPRDSPLDFGAVYGRTAPVVCEIGFGNGNALLAYALAHPEVNLLGVEVHRPGVGALLLKLNAAGVANVRVIAADAKEVLRDRVPDGALAGVHLFFPDPWPKKRHHKRRLVQPEFASLVRAKLAPGGHLRVATDSEDYAQQILRVLSGTPGLRNAVEDFAERPDFRPVTRFEGRGHEAGRRSFDLDFVAVPHEVAPRDGD